LSPSLELSGKARLMGEGENLRHYANHGCLERWERPGESKTALMGKLNGNDEPGAWGKIFAQPNKFYGRKSMTTGENGKPDQQFILEPLNKKKAKGTYAGRVNFWKWAQELTLNHWGKRGGSDRPHHSH